MRIAVISVGRGDRSYVADGIDELTKRLKPYCKIEAVEIPALPDGKNPSEWEVIQREEGRILIKKIPDNAYTVALTEEGKMKTSMEFSSLIANCMNRGFSRMAFLIGGSRGLSAEVKERANETLSLSRMTFPHQVARLLLFEQIFRAFKIIRGEEYHK